MDKNVIKSDIFLSIVIPIFNVENFLARCLISILNQKVDFKYEIIAVNDCSTDLSYFILMEYKHKYENITIVNHQTNKRLSVARRSGMNLCKGNYIMQVDSDDWLEEGSLQKIYCILTSSNPDIAVFNYYIENSNKERVLISPIKKSHLVAEKKEIQNLFLGAPWNKVVKKELLDDTIFGLVGINNGEDLVYSTELYLKAKNILLSDYSFYVYFNNMTSLTKVENSLSFLSNQQLVLNDLVKLFKKYQANYFVIDFVINYYLKFIYLEIFRYNFKLRKENRVLVLQVLRDIFLNEIFKESDKKKLYASINSKTICLLEIFKRFGIKKTFGLIIK